MALCWQYLGLAWWDMAAALFHRRLDCQLFHCFTSQLLQIVVNVASVALVYVGLRAFGAMDNSLEDMQVKSAVMSPHCWSKSILILASICCLAQVLEEKNALLGPGLATNYWFSYLKWICTGLLLCFG